MENTKKVRLLRPIKYNKVWHEVGKVVVWPASVVKTLDKFVEEYKEPEVIEDDSKASEFLDVLAQLESIKKNHAKAIVEAGFSSLDELKELSIEQLEALPTIGRSTAEKLIEELELVEEENNDEDEE